MIIIPIILFFAVLAWDVATDFKKWKQQQNINHAKQWWLRAALLFPSVTGFANQLHIHWFWAMIVSTAMCAFVWWLLFDGIYNRLRGFGWWFNGSLDAASQDSFFDRLLMQLSDGVEAIIKITLAAGATVIYTCIYVYKK